MASPTTAPNPAADRPFSPRRLPFFYGWVMVGGSVVAMLASIPGQTIGVGVFSDHLIEAWGLDRVNLSLAYMVGTLASSGCLPYAGNLLDRVGSRWMMTLSAVGLGASLLVLSQADRAFGAGDAMPLAVAFVAMAVCFLSIRFFGQGCLTMVSRVVIGKWFERRRGLATALAGTIITLGFNASPVFINWLIGAAGWRSAYLILAATVGVGVAVVGWGFFRDNPEECGLRMDGDLAPSAEAGDHVPSDAPAAPPGERRQFTRAEALRTVAFWAFSLGLGCHGFILTAVPFHAAALGEEMGLTRDEAFAIFWPMSLFSVCSNLVGGWFADRTKLKYLLYVYLAAQAAGTVGLMRLDAEWGRALLYLGYGVAGGLFVQLSTVTWPRFFGRAHLGAITGVNLSLLVVCSAVAPLLFSLGPRLGGSFLPVIQLYWFAPVTLFALALKADNPRVETQ